MGGKLTVKTDRCSAFVNLPCRGLLTGQVHVFVKRAHTVDDAVIGYLDDAVCNSLRKLVVVACEDDVLLKRLHAVV